jgi:DNA-binding transcriptional ArsR family regulator
VLKYAEELDQVFHALADPTRRGILERLSVGPASVTELARPISMSLPAVHQHLRVLETSGLVRSRKVGRVRTCELDVKRLSDAQTWIEDRRSQWIGRLDRLDAYLATPPAKAPSKKGKKT